MGNLEISLLDKITIRIAGRPLTRFRSQKELALLAYLVHSGQTHGREALADLFWDARSTKQSLSNLRTVLARLRKRVGDQLIITRKTVTVSPQVHEQTDSVRLKALLDRAFKEDPATRVNDLRQGLDLYKGEFMAGFSLPDAPRFNDWLIVEQEYLRRLAMRGFRQLARWQEETGSFNAGIVTAQKWVSWDPLDETAQQQLMRLLVFDQNVAEALQIYEKFVQLLHLELGIPPSPSTTNLYNAILDGSLTPPDIRNEAPHNIPRALMPLFGRQQEIKNLSSMLISPDYPLVSITGVGGVGKTSLALAVSRRLLVEKQHPFADGIWFISLETIEAGSLERTREEVAALIGQVIGIYFHGQSDLWTQLLSHLGAKNMLIILDNVEQFLTSASDLIVDLLQAAGGIQLLVTSRRSLALAATAVIPLQGLPTPADVSIEALNNESVRMFADRASRMPIRFHVQNHLAEVVAICQFVQGMPLAIELAAASLGRLLISEIMPALSGNLQQIKSTRSDLAPRQRTLHALFEYSWQLLDSRERTALAQISIFRGGFDRQAGQAVLQELASTLYNLQHHALLSRNEMGRFRMHPLLRQLAQEKLNQPDRAELSQQSRRAHSSYYANFMQSFALDLRLGRGKDAIQKILPEQANLRAAWHDAIQTGQWQTLATMLDGAHYFYQRKGFFSEEALLVDEAVQRLPTHLEVSDQFLTRLHIRLLIIRARDFMNMAQFEEGSTFAQNACRLAQELCHQQLEGQARLAWARILSTQHQREAALVQFEQVVALAKAVQDQFLEVDGWIGIGRQLIWLENMQKTSEVLLHALDLCRDLHYQLGEMETLRYLGTMSTRQEAYDMAVENHSQALALSRALGDVTAEAEELGSLGVVMSQRGNLAASQAYHKEALATFRRLNMAESEQWILGELGYTSIRLGDYAGGEELLQQALAITTQLQDTFWQGWVKLRLAGIRMESGLYEDALTLIEAAFQTAEQFQYINFKAAVLYEWGNLLTSRKNWPGAEQKFLQSFNLRHESGRVEQALPSLAGLAYVTFQQDRTADAGDLAEQLWQTWQESPQMAQRADLKLYWRLGQVWHGLGDNRAKELWQKGHHLLQERAAKIPDPAARQQFLTRVPVNRALTQIELKDLHQRTHDFSTFFI